MPWRARHPCPEPGCPQLLPAGRARCPAHQLPQLGHRWPATRAAYLARHPTCQAPGCGAPATDVDHVVARAAGGSDDRTNLQALCHSCHSRKTARRDGGFGNARA